MIPQEEIEAKSLKQTDVAPGHTVRVVTADEAGTLCIIAPGFTTIRACVDCGVLIAGGPTRCLPCGNKPAPAECDTCGRPEHGGEHTELGASLCGTCRCTNGHHKDNCPEKPAQPTEAKPGSDERFEQMKQVAQENADLRAQLATQTETSARKRVEVISLRDQLAEAQKRIAELEQANDKLSESLSADAALKARIAELEEALDAEAPMRASLKQALLSLTKVREERDAAIARAEMGARETARWVKHHAEAQDGWKKAENERDAAIARAEKAEEQLDTAIDLLRAFSDDVNVAAFLSEFDAQKEGT